MKRIPNHVKAAVEAILSPYGLIIAMPQVAGAVLEPGPLPPRRLRRKEAAKYLGVHIKTLDNWVRKKKLQVQRVGRTLLIDVTNIQEQEGK